MAQCPTPNKLRFFNKRDAIERAYQDSLEHGADLRVYRCPCGMHHLTTHHNNSWKGKVERRVELRQKRDHRKKRIALEHLRRAFLRELERRQVE